MAGMMERADDGAEAPRASREKQRHAEAVAKPTRRRAGSTQQEAEEAGLGRQGWLLSADDEPSLDELEEQADAAADFLEELLARMDIDAIAEPNPHEGHMYVDIVDGPEEDMSLLIGRHGQTLEAIQELTRMVVGRRLDQRVRVIVDVEDYRKRREARLEEHARELAERVLRDAARRKSSSR